MKLTLNPGASSGAPLQVSAGTFIGRKARLLPVGKY